ncbi:hypothetical protein KY284_034849 [Solanum tuberosum]|nr:hypothetical protein KY284_034849 [Solanum tuberosum]
MLEVSSSKLLASESKRFVFWVKLVAPGLPSVGYLSYVVCELLHRSRCFTLCAPKGQFIPLFIHTFLDLFLWGFMIITMKLFDMKNRRGKPGVDCRSISQFLNQESQGTKWAVLVAGSNGWDNYRHQADVCHAYQLLKDGGLKDENIIVFMYDDIAHNRENPRPGVIINNPHGNDVYKGVPKDYLGEDVNAKNFYNVILANKSGIVGGSGKVLNSGPNDHIFIYYTDHGGPGIVAMPSGELVYANDLVNVLKKKHASGTYDRLVFYLEACESGSMFDGLLPEGLDIYVMTASEPDEDSWATYCGEGTPEDPCLVQCPPREFQGVCLGDLYSIAWMEDSDVEDRTADSVQGQYSRVANRTAANIIHGGYGSHVTQYGDLVVSFDPLATYMGENFKNHSHDSLDAKSFSTSSSRNVDQRSTELFYLFTKHQNAPEGSDEKYEARVKLNEVMSQRNQVDNNVKYLGELLFGVEKGNEVLHSVRSAGQPLVDNWDCLKSYVKIFEVHCGRLTTYGRKHVRGIANICNAGITSEKMAAMSAQACSSRSISQFLTQKTKGTKWAVLIAGSAGWTNYRHQADVCHAYQIMKAGGLKDENIIVFMYDDIANNTENPKPGVIINNPHGHDVYKGVPKDYVGDGVNAKNFFNVILANKSGVVGGSGKVLKSGPNDHIFIYYADHGGPGVIAMPNEVIYAHDLVNVLKKKHASGTYDRLVFYLEACESGSMFDGLLPEGLDIYVMTAAKPDEDSYGTYCGESTPVDSCLGQCPPLEFKGVCLGDLYSVSSFLDGR